MVAGGAGGLAAGAWRGVGDGGWGVEVFRGFESNLYVCVYRDGHSSHPVPCRKRRGILVPQTGKVNSLRLVGKK